MECLKIVSDLLMGKTRLEMLRTSIVSCRYPVLYYLNGEGLDFHVSAKAAYTIRLSHNKERCSLDEIMRW